jgi:hypothetical protein
VSPNLAGRVAAAFALGAQVALQRGDTGSARRWLGQAASVFAQARTTDVGELVTAYPHAHYPEDSWADDMELGAAELARAGRLLGDRRADGDLGIPDGANACPVVDGENRFAAYDMATSRFLDDVRAWPSVEPAIDFTATGALALALTARR